MIRYLIVLQFPFLFFFSLLVCLNVFWVSGPVPLIYGTGLLVLALLGSLLHHMGRRSASRPVTLSVLLLGACVAAWVYRPLHLGAWETNSIGQALGVMALGALCLMASSLTSRESTAPGRSHHLPLALAGLGILWLAALDYMSAPLLLSGLVLALGIARGTGHSEPSNNTLAHHGARLGGLARYLVFLAGVSLAAVAFDFRRDPTWIVYLALALVCAGVAAAASTRAPARALLAAALLQCLLLIASSLVPAVLLHPAHSIAGGLVLGSALRSLEWRGDESPGLGALAGSSLYWALGILTAIGFAQHLPAWQWRLVLLLPIIPLLWGRLGAREPEPANCAG